MNWSYLPEDVVLEQLLRLSIYDILQTCQTNAKIAQICQNKNLWYHLLGRDYAQVNLSTVADPKLRYRQENLIAYILQTYTDPEYTFYRNRHVYDYTLGFESYADFVQAQSKFVYELSPEKLNLLEYIRNKIVPISSNLVYDWRFNDSYTINNDGFLFDNAGTLILTPARNKDNFTKSYQSMKLSHIHINSIDFTLLNFILQSYPQEDADVLGFSDYQAFVEAQKDILQRLNKEQLQMLYIIINQVIPISDIASNEPPVGRTSYDGFVFNADQRLVLIGYS